MDRDLVVIGGGAAGIAAALEGVRRRASTLLIQDGPIGGDCTFTGCVPSKTLISAAAQQRSFIEAKAAIREAVGTIAATEDDAAMRREGVEVIHGRAGFVSSSAVEVDGTRIHAGAFVVATGARPVVPPVDGIEDVPCLTNETIFDLDRLPESMVVVGGGPVGCELAQAFHRFGSRVTVLDMTDRLLPGEEPEASDVLCERFTSAGMDVRLNRTVLRAEKVASGVCLHTDDGARVEAGSVFVAAGRRPDVAWLRLDAAGIETGHDGYIHTDDRMRTTAPNVFAAGDVTGRVAFTHAAYKMGSIAAANALSRRPRQRFDASEIPAVTFTDPEVARVGMTESQAAPHGGRIAYLPMTEFDRAICEGRTSGFVKLIAGPRKLIGNAGGGRVLGATIVAARAGEMIHEVALAMRAKMFTGRLAQTVHAYPTWALAIQEAAAQFFMERGGRSARPAEAQ